MRYLPHTNEEIAAMLAAVGLPSLDALYSSIPAEARLGRPLDLPEGVDEPTLMRELEALAEKNAGARMLSFLGAGAYEHHFPPAADQLLLRSEFYTAYTPYQPEVAQGTLQAIWEYQTIVSELYGLNLSNASLYDGASATAEAALMACRLTKRGKVVLCTSVHPDYRAVTATYLAGRDDMSVVVVPFGADGLPDLAALSAAIDSDTAGVIVGYPSFVGPLADLRPLAKAVHDRGALLVTATSEPGEAGRRGRICAALKALSRKRTIRRSAVTVRHRAACSAGSAGDCSIPSARRNRPRTVPAGTGSSSVCPRRSA